MRIIEVQPIENPVPQREPVKQPEREPIPRREPTRTPERQPDKVPA